MKKKLLLISIAVSLTATIFVGCGADKAEGGSGESPVVNVESLVEDIPQTEAAPSIVESNETETGTEVADWSTAYDSYFDEHDIMRDNSMMSATVTEEGITMTVKVAMSGNSFYMGFDFGTEVLDLYATEEKMYARTVMQGEEAWSIAPITSEEDAESVKSMNTTAVDDDSITSWTYREEVTEGGIVYDVLDVTADNDGETQNLKCYVNRETQEIDKYALEQEGMEVVLAVEDIDGIEIPTEAEKGTESTAQDIMMQLFTVIMSAAEGSAQ